MSAATEPVEAPLPEGPVDETVPDSGPAPGPDRHTTAGKLADLYGRIDLAVQAGNAAAVERQHADVGQLPYR